MGLDGPGFWGPPPPGVPAPSWVGGGAPLPRWSQRRRVAQAAAGFPHPSIPTGAGGGDRSQPPLLLQPPAWGHAGPPVQPAPGARDGPGPVPWLGASALPAAHDGRPPGGPPLRASQLTWLGGGGAEGRGPR